MFRCTRSASLARRPLVHQLSCPDCILRVVWAPPLDRSWSAPLLGACGSGVRSMSHAAPIYDACCARTNQKPGMQHLAAPPRACCRRPFPARNQRLFSCSLVCGRWHKRLWHVPGWGLLPAWLARLTGRVGAVGAALACPLARLTSSRKTVYSHPPCAEYYILGLNLVRDATRSHFC